MYSIASSPGHSQILYRSRQEEAWDHCYVTSWKWWTRYKLSPHYVLTMSTISGPWCSNNPRPSPNFFPRLGVAWGRGYVFYICSDGRDFCGLSSGELKKNVAIVIIMCYLCTNASMCTCIQRSGDTNGTCTPNFMWSLVHGSMECPISSLSLSATFLLPHEAVDRPLLSLLPQEIWLSSSQLWEGRRLPLEASSVLPWRLKTTPTTISWDTPLQIIKVSVYVGVGFQFFDWFVNC